MISNTGKNCDTKNEEAGGHVHDGSVKVKYPTTRDCTGCPAINLITTLKKSKIAIQQITRNPS